ncbi:MAG: alpha,alpha-phosphotrehalase [Selenomonadaceae bacterium]|nr:alpha,alpha-phosphotrehalase [Selenomonadaceae bacterium]
MDIRDKVVYQIYPRSFQDSDGDGIGDLRGILRRLDYLRTLGADYLWLTPFFPSPQRDNGYDVADYRSVDPRFGTMADLEELISEAGKRNMGIMLDMVFNHTSTEHEWFQKALSGNQDYQDYYIFREGEPDKLPTNWASKFGGPAWEYVPGLSKWYLHLFDVTQADLNWENPAVREELKDILRFWKEKGIWGFRFDVVNLISKPERFEDDFEGDGRRFYTDGPHVHEFLQEMVRDAGIEDMVTVGEMSSTSIENCIRYSNPAEKELAMVFSFHHLKVDYRDGKKWELMDADIPALKQLFADWQLGMQEGGGWNALFYNNHDQPRVVSRFGDDKKYWKESAKMLAASIHFMRGTPYVYQGEEISMTNAGYQAIEEYSDVESLNYYGILRREGKSEQEALHIIGERSRDNGRTPMQWTAGAYAGFSEVEPWLSIPENYRYINAELEQQDEDSIWHFYRRLIALRKERKVIAEGKIEFMERENPNVLSYRRWNEQEELAVLCNFRGKHAGLLGTSPADYEREGWQKLIGNYDGSEERLRPFEVLVYTREKRTKQ